MEEDQEPTLLERISKQIGPNADEDSLGYFRVPTFDAIRGKIPYKKPIQLPDYAGYEDLYTRWEQQKPNWLGTRPTIEQRVDDFEGIGPGRIIVRSATNAGPEGIYFYPDNTEYNKALAQDTRDIADIQFIGGTIASVLAAGKAGYRLRTQQKRQLETRRANEATYIGSNAPQLKGRLQKQIEPIVTGMVTKNDPVALGRQEFDPRTPGMSGDYAFRMTEYESLQAEIAKANLETDRVNRFILGLDTNIKGIEKTLIQNSEVGSINQNDFLGVGRKDYLKRLENLKKEYPVLVQRIEGMKDSFLWNEHHINPRTAPVDFYVGLTDIKDRNIIRDLLVTEFNVFSGNSPLNRIGLPAGIDRADVHGMVHKWLAPRVGERSDVLKHKWLTEAGIEIGPLQTRSKGISYIEGQKYLSREDRLKFNQWFKELTPQEREPYIREYGKIIQESQGIITTLMEQFNLLYKIPQGYQLEVDYDSLVKILDSIDPTSTEELHLPIIRDIIQEVLSDKKLSAINPDTEEVIELIKPKTDVQIRMDDLLSMLNAANQPGWTGSNKEIVSWANELNEIMMNEGLLDKGQLELDLKESNLTAYLEKARKLRLGNIKLTDIDNPIVDDPKLKDITE